MSDASEREKVATLGEPVTDVAYPKPETTLRDGPSVSTHDAAAQPVALTPWTSVSRWHVVDRSGWVIADSPATVLPQYSREKAEALAAKWDTMLPSRAPHRAVRLAVLRDGFDPDMPLYTHPTPPRAASPEPGAVEARCIGCGSVPIGAVLSVIRGGIACCPDCSTLTMGERNAIRQAVADRFAAALRTDATATPPRAEDDGRLTDKPASFAGLALDVLACIPADWSPNQAREWGKLGPILAEFIDDLREGRYPAPRADATADDDWEKWEQVVTDVCNRLGIDPNWADSESASPVDCIVAAVEMDRAKRADATAGGVTDTERLDWLNRQRTGSYAPRFNETTGTFAGLGELRRYVWSVESDPSIGDIRTAIDAALRAAQPETSGGKG